MRSPIPRPRATPHGAYGYLRATKRHNGLDIAARRGAVVVAPERMRVIAVADGTAAPWRRYGPRVVAGIGQSGWVHVLAHLETARPVVGQVIEEGEEVGLVSRLNHLHWEVRRRDRAPWPLATRAADTIDPLEWLKLGPPTAAPPPDGVLDAIVRRGGAVVDSVKAAVAARTVSELVVVAILLAYASNRRHR